MTARTDTAPAATDDARSFRSEPYAWYVVIVLCFGSIVSMLDRQIVNLLVDPIKADLGVSDTQISLLQGFAFAIFYAVMAVPLGRLADRWSRRGTIFWGTLLFSGATFASGLTRGFGGLVRGAHGGRGRRGDAGSGRLFADGRLHASEAAGARGQPVRRQLLRRQRHRADLCGRRNGVAGNDRDRPAAHRHAARTGSSLSFSPRCRAGSLHS